MKKMMGQEISTPVSVWTFPRNGSISALQMDKGVSLAESRCNRVMFLVQNTSNCILQCVQNCVPDVLRAHHPVSTVLNRHDALLFNASNVLIADLDNVRYFALMDEVKRENLGLALLRQRQCAGIPSERMSVEIEDTNQKETIALGHLDVNVCITLYAAVLSLLVSAKASCLTQDFGCFMSVEPLPLQRCGMQTTSHIEGAPEVVLQSLELYHTHVDNEW